jgi:hypothetical protein
MAYNDRMIVTDELGETLSQPVVEHVLRIWLDGLKKATKTLAKTGVLRE